MSELVATTMQDGGAGATVRRTMLRFLRTLRDNGFAVGLGEARDALLLAAGEASDRPALLRGALKALLCGRRDEWRRFDDLFDAYWLGRGRKRAVRATGSTAGPRASIMSLGAPQPTGGRPGMPDMVSRAEGESGGAPEGQRGGAARHESIDQTDLRHIVDPDELARAHALAERLAERMRHRLSRRQRAGRRGRKLDLRRTIRRSISRGGTPIDLVRRARRDKPLRLVVLIDVSGSMSQYSAAFIRFLHGVLGAFRQAEGYVFHTRLIHVSPALKEANPVKAVERLTLMAHGWAGGTRIGESLAAFNRHHAPRVVNGRTVVIIVSDGYDTGRPEQFAAEMAALRRRTRRIVWLNPLLGWPGYEPTAGGMSAALPFVELFAPAHNLASLAALEDYLARI